MIDLQNKSPKLLVIGDLIIDQYLWGNSERISPEAPVQIVNVDNENTILGGAGLIKGTGLFSLEAQHSLNIIGYGTSFLTELEPDNIIAFAWKDAPGTAHFTEGTVETIISNTKLKLKAIHISISHDRTHAIAHAIAEQ